MGSTDKDINTIIKENEKLIYFVINRSYKTFVGDEDVYQMGLIGLWHAIENFDDSKGYAFATYATKCIFNSIEMEVRSRFRKKYTLSTVSLDEPLKELKGKDIITIGDSLADPNDCFRSVEIYLDIELVRSKLHGRDLQVFEWMLSGYNAREIGEFCEVSRAYGDILVKRVRKKIKLILETGESTMKKRKKKKNLA